MLPEVAANLTWGDADYRTLYITATKSVYRLRAKARGFVPAVHSYAPRPIRHRMNRGTQVRSIRRSRTESRARIRVEAFPPEDAAGELYPHLKDCHSKDACKLEGLGRWFRSWFSG
jgi:hypothetical protein